MPEGDTVYRAARLLDRRLSGQVLTGTDFRVPQHATADLSGATVVETRSRGKHLLTRLRTPEGEEWTLHTHLKMEGAWRVHEPHQPWRRPAHQARVVLSTDRAVAVQTNGATTRVYADLNADGDYTIGTDLAISFNGNVKANLTTVGDYLFV